MNCPDQFKDMTPDTVAECVEGISSETYGELWAALDNPAFSKRALGGDGSNGTTEVPDDFSGGLGDAWSLLSDKAKENIVAAANDKRNAEI